ncbi:MULTISPECIES: hypothetical protein [unclassified Rhizobium]|nr:MULTISPECIES: hypothetical protein [unclassified Rhizobium]
MFVVEESRDFATHNRPGRISAAISRAIAPVSVSAFCLKSAPKAAIFRA